MPRNPSLRAEIVHRLLAAAGLLGAGALGAHAAGCGGAVVVDGTRGDGVEGVDGEGGEGGEGGSGGFGGAGGDSSVVTVGPGPGTTVAATSTGATSTGATSTSVTATSVAASSSSTGGGTSWECFWKDPAHPCPSVEEASSQYFCSNSGMYAQTFVSGPVEENDSCCYEVVTSGPCGVGRPFLEEGVPVLAPRRGTGQGWVASCAPSLEGLTAEARKLLAERWTGDALMEHASVASFGRFALELLALGAPASLVRAAHEAALDEIRHAELCFALASAYGGAPVQPGPFPFGGAVPVRADLADVAARAVLEGCVGETLAALEAAERAERAVDPAVRAALSAIAADEARHAELAWRAVAWALAQGSPEEATAVRAAVREAFDAAARGGCERGEADALDASLARHGLFSAEERSASKRRALRDVVLPGARVLLASGSASPLDARAAQPSA